LLNERSALLQKTVQIAPSILAADFTRLGEQVQAIEQARAERLHIDVMDGHFVPNLTMGPLIIEAVRRVTDMPLDVHLMVSNPEKLLGRYADAGATSISVHYEACDDVYRALRAVERFGCRVGLAINPHTSARALSEIIGYLDLVLVMTVSPGFGGQKLIPETLPKITKIRLMADENRQQDLDIVVDGGVNMTTATSVVAAGANVLVAGSAIFEHKKSIQSAIDELRASASNTAS
jgi:ribulose-phosphate 3-epimerase